MGRTSRWDRQPGESPVCRCSTMDGRFQVPLADSVTGVTGMVHPAKAGWPGLPRRMIAARPAGVCPAKALRQPGRRGWTTAGTARWAVTQKHRRGAWGGGRDTPCDVGVCRGGLNREKAVQGTGDPAGLGGRSRVTWCSRGGARDGSFEAEHVWRPACETRLGAGSRAASWPVKRAHGQTDGCNPRGTAATRQPPRAINPGGAAGSPGLEVPGSR